MLIRIIPILIAICAAWVEPAYSQPRPFHVFATGSTADSIHFISFAKLRQAWPLVTIEVYYLLDQPKRSAAGILYDASRQEVEVDCNARTSRLRRYDRLNQGEIVQRGGLQRDPFEYIEAGSIGAFEVAYACDGTGWRGKRSFTSMRDARLFANSLLRR